MEALTNENAKPKLVENVELLDALSSKHPLRPRSTPQSSTTRSRRVNRGDDANDAQLFDIPEEQEEAYDSGTYHFKLEHCSQCHEPGDFFCGRCCDAPSSAKLSGTETSYCSTTCQTLHLERHQPACNILAKRKALTKIAKLLCSIWRKIRAKAYPFHITQIGKEDGRLAVYQGDECRNMSGRIFFDAPNLTTTLESPELREQILLMGTSRLSIALLHTIAGELFHGTSYSHQELSSDIR